MTLDTFFKKFDQFADAPNAVARMRELVLELAVQGKLVPQNHNNQPALDDIIQRGELITKAPFEIPKQWRWSCLRKLADINGGFAFKSHDYSEQGIRVIRISDFDEVGFKNHKIVRHAFTSNLKKFTLDKGNILMAMTGGTVGKSYYVRSLPEPMVVNQRVATIKVSAESDPSYIDILIRSEMTQLVIQNAKNSTNDNISMEDIKGFPVPLPPLAEQKRIVAKVDELMALCDRLEAQQQARDAQSSALARASLARFAEAPTPANLNLLFHLSYSITPADLRKAVIALAVRGKLLPQNLKDEPAEVLIERIAKKRVSKKAKDYTPVGTDEIPYKIPRWWSWVRLGNLALSSDSGWSPQCGSERRSGNAWGVLKVSAVSWGVFKPDENKALPKGVDARPDCEVRPGDFLLSRANTEELVARSIVVDQTPPHLMMSDKIVRFTFTDDIEKSFINLANLSIPSREYYARNASGTSSSMKNIGREVMCNLPVALPPLAEQRRIVAKVDQLMALVDQLETQLAASRATGKKLLEALVVELTNSNQS